MELVVFVVADFLAGIAVFCLLGALYGLVHRPAIYFPPLLGVKMAAAAVLGLVLFGIGGIVLATWVFADAFTKREDHGTLKGVLVGLAIATFGSGAMLFVSMWLAWQVFD
ncbi:MAG: hypothetical protein ACU85V_06340 [Gammaproteobacteria bacterium]